jgi:hypothetical protein
MQLHKIGLARVSAILASLALMSSVSSHAQITGSIWETDGSNNADTVPGGTPNMMFSSSQVFYGSSDDSTISGFMNFGGTVTTFNNIQGGSSPSDGADNLHIQLNGMIYLAAGNNSFGVGHDDGLRINVAGLGTVLDTPGPTSFVLTPFNIDNTGAAGVFPFTLDYNECCGPPAYLEFAYASGAPVTGNVPDTGATMGLFGLGLTGLAAFARRIRK